MFANMDGKGSNVKSTKVPAQKLVIDAPVHYPKIDWNALRTQLGALQEIATV